MAPIDSFPGCTYACTVLGLALPALATDSLTIANAPGTVTRIIAGASANISLEWTEGTY